MCSTSRKNSKLVLECRERKNRCSKCVEIREFFCCPFTQKLRNFFTEDNFGHLKKQLKELKTHDLFLTVYLSVHKVVNSDGQASWLLLIVYIYLLLRSLTYIATFCQCITFPILKQEQVEDKCWLFNELDERVNG